MTLLTPIKHCLQFVWNQVLLFLNCSAHNWTAQHCATTPGSRLCNDKRLIYISIQLPILEEMMILQEVVTYV